jgi:hypothetical protein
LIQGYALYQNYPNPFNPATKIGYQLPKAGMVNIKIYDMLGRQMAELVNEQKGPGGYEVTFDASRYASGVYIYQMVVSTVDDTKPSHGSAVKQVFRNKMILLR